MKKLFGIFAAVICICSIAVFSVSAEEYTPIITKKWNGHTYAVYDVSINWNDAKAYCESIGGHLAVITSENEQNFISKTISNANYTKDMYWLGGYEANGKWNWITGENFKYTNWNPLEPTGGQHYLTLITNLLAQKYGNIEHGRWLDNPLNGTSGFTIGQTGFICEWGTVQYVPVSTVIWKGNTYAVYDIPINWNGAKAYCESIGGHLVTITSAAENKTVTDLIYNGKLRNYFIGGKETETEGVWQWITGEKWAYTNWGNGEPNNPDENWSEITKGFDSIQSGEWNNTFSDGQVSGFVCEWEKVQKYKPEKTVVWNGHTYSVYDVSMTWTDAKAYCESIGGHLVTITSADEQTNIETILSNANKLQYWLGLSCASGTMEWVTGEPLNYTNWDASQPDASNIRGFNEQYVHIYTQKSPYRNNSEAFKWNDMYNDNTYPGNEDFYSPNTVGFICEWDYDKTVPSMTGTSISDNDGLSPGIIIAIVVIALILIEIPIVILLIRKFVIGKK